MSLETMKCPACDQPLSTLHSGKVVLDVCQHGCGGIWFDTFELNVVSAAAVIDESVVIEVDKKTTPSVTVSGKRLCPRCKTQPMLKHFFSRKKSVEIDECPACGGHWLDHGELERIHAEIKELRKDSMRTDVLTVGAIKQYFGESDKLRGSQSATPSAE